MYRFTEIYEERTTDMHKSELRLDMCCYVCFLSDYLALWDFFKPDTGADKGVDIAHKCQ